jgi:NitT/TauT family transport system ATP-binding protein
MEHSMDRVAQQTPGIGGTRAHEATVGRGGAAPRPASIEMSDVFMDYELEGGDTVAALRGVSLTVDQGQIMCVLGPSGHGKSTMLNLIAGFLTPSSGEVRTNGQLVTGPGPDRGVVFQRDTLFLWKRVRDNIEFGPKARGVPKDERERIVRNYLELIGLERFGLAWPKQLSGGMRRRVAIAAVFANEPEVLLMDEPFVGLDYVRRADLHRVLLELWGRANNTVFFITHDVDEALALGDRAIVVVNGQIAYDVAIPLPRPRTPESISSEEASEIRREVLSNMHLDAGV